MGQNDIGKIADLLGDASFVSWVKSPDKGCEQKWKIWLKNNRHRGRDVSLARELILRMHFNTKHPTEVEMESAFDEVLAKIRQQPESVSKNKWIGNSIFETFNLIYYAKIAAVILVLITSFAAVYLIHRNNLILETHQAESVKIIKRSNPQAIRSKIILPDGSLVWLNAESELIYPVLFDKYREVKLKGEAYFEVVKDTLKPFKVKTRLSNIKVLGTSFNVNTHDDGLGERVSLVSGKVAVSLAESDTSQLLLPGEQIVINRSGISHAMPFDSLEVTGWTNGWLVFKNASKEEIINKLSRWYGVKIIMLNEPSERWNVNGYFRDQALVTVLDRLSFSKDFDYEIDDKTINIKFK